MQPHPLSQTAPGLEDGNPDSQPVQTAYLRQEHHPWCGAQLPEQLRKFEQITSQLFARLQPL